MEIHVATVGDLSKILPVLCYLRPHLDLTTFTKQFENQLKENFQIIYLYEDNTVVSVASFRTIQTFFSGKTLYIDDLVTHPKHKKHGYAGKLLEWIKDYAKKNQYNHISLDSGFQRKEAHKLYLKHGFEIESLHFGARVDSYK